MVNLNKMKMKLAIYSIIGITVIITFLYIELVVAKVNPIHFGWGAVFGMSVAIIMNGLRKYYEDINRESKIENQVQ
jgi:hypothetical protein